MVSNKSFPVQEFLTGVRQYLSAYALVRETDAHGRPGRNALTTGLGENAFYLFDAEAVCAVGHAIEDMALEEADGTLLAAFQQFKNFEPHRERYLHLAATIERAEILATGTAPRGTRHLKFTKDAKSSLQDFRIVLYQGRHRQALMIGRQANQAAAFDDRQFTGFFTFNPRLIASVRQDVMDVVAGRAPLLREFTRLHALDQAAKQIKSEFAREKDAVDHAVARLLTDSRRYRAKNFASDLEKGLSRLHQWKTRLPELLARAEGR